MEGIITLRCVYAGENVEIIALKEADAQGTWQRSPVKAGFSKQISRRVIRADLLDEEQRSNFCHYRDRNILTCQTLQECGFARVCFLKITANHDQQKCSTKQQA